VCGYILVKQEIDYEASFNYTLLKKDLGLTREADDVAASNSSLESFLVYDQRLGVFTLEARTLKNQGFW